MDELPDFDEELGVLAAIEEDDNVDVEIELKEEEPAFLKGYGRQSLQVGKGGRTGRTNGRKISPFYRTLSAQKP